MRPSRESVTFLSEHEDAQRIREIAERERVPLSIVLRRVVRHGLQLEERRSQPSGEAA